MKVFGWRFGLSGYWAKPLVYTCYGGTGRPLPDDPDTEEFHLTSIHIGPFVIARA